MTSKEEDKDGSDSTISISLFTEFTPLAESTGIDESHLTDDPPPPQPPAPEPTKDKPSQPERDSEPLPSSVCFTDQSDSQQPTRPIGPMQDAEKIISETKDVISNLFQVLLKQRRFLLVSAYQISSLQSIVLDHYSPLVSKIDTFLTYSNSFQNEWFFQYYYLLSPYADYALALEDSADKVEVNEIPGSVPESILKHLAENVINNMFAGGLQVKVQRSLNMDVSQKMDMRREAFQSEYLPLKLWMDLFEIQSENAKRVEGTCFELLSSVDLLDVDGNFNSKTK